MRILKLKAFSIVQKIIEFYNLNFKKTHTYIFTFHEIYDNYSLMNKNYSISFSSFVSLYLKLKEKNVKFYSLNSLNQIKFDQKNCFISFDDVHTSIFDKAIPFLLENRVPFTLFITEKTFDSFNEKTMKYFFSILSSPYITIGFHSKSHYQNINLSNNEFLNEMDPSILKTKINKDINLFSFPYGSLIFLKSKSPVYLSKLGYKFAFTSIKGYINKKDLNRNPYFLPRFNINESNFLNYVK